MSLISKARAFGWRMVVLAVMARIGRAFHLNVRLRTPDRLVLEEKILPQVAADPGLRAVLLVGTDWYCAHYPAALQGKRVTSIDPDPARARYGATTHIVDRLEGLGRHVPPRSLDAIICNGVYGWGLDTLADCERSFEACARALRPQGLLVLGWNDVPEHDPVPLTRVKALAAFTAVEWAPLDGHRHLVEGSDMRHTFAFFRAPAA